MSLSMELMPEISPRGLGLGEYKILAYQTRFSAIFSGTDKSLTYPYPTRGVDKKRIITCCQYIGIGGHITLLLRCWELMSRTMSIFNMADVIV